MKDVRGRVNPTLFGARLRSLRLKRDYTQDALSRDLHVSGETISNWERGRCLPTLDMVGDVALYFDCSIEWLLGVTCEDNKEKTAKTNEEIDKAIAWCQTMARDKSSTYGIYTKLSGERREGFELGLRAVMSRLYSMKKSEKVSMSEVESE